MSTPDLAGRDAQVVQLVSRFHQLSSKHIQTLLFHDRASLTSCRIVLNRLVAGKWLHRIEHRMVGGARGGSGQYVYALGRRGFYLRDDGDESPRRAFNAARVVNYHALAVADAWVALKGLEREGVLSLTGLSTEPDCWTTIGHYDIRPDMLVQVRKGGESARLWFEIDMGTEGQRQLKAKLQTYWDAFNIAGEHGWTRFPSVWWVACDDERARELRWLISQGHEDAQALFRVMTLKTLPENLR